MRRFASLFGAVSLVLASFAMSQVSLADSLPQDTSASLIGGFGQLTRSRGLMVRVPIEANGSEAVALAEMRADFSTSLPSATNDLPGRWNNSYPVSSNLFNVNNDTSTCGGRWRGCRRNCYYNFTNVDYSYGWNSGYYNYGNPYSYPYYNQFNYGGEAFGGYNYYYYPSMWY